MNWTKPGVREVILTAVVFLAFFGGVFLENNEVQNVVCYMVTILLIIYLFMVFVLQARNSIKINSLIVNFIVILFAGADIQCRICEYGCIYYGQGASRRN